jgi:hypothetical protein
MKFGNHGNNIYKIARNRCGDTATCRKCSRKLDPVWITDIGIQWNLSCIIFRKELIIKSTSMLLLNLLHRKSFMYPELELFPQN